MLYKNFSDWKRMPEYLSPGVYVEEFESGGKPMEGVSTSTAGFIGLAERGAVEGLPELVTNFGDFQRIFGSYLSENAFGEYRYLAYAVEHFFINGGGKCYVMRVAPPDAREAKNFTEADQNDLILKISARNPGTWGEKVRILLVPSSKAKTQIYEANGESYKVKNNAGFFPGDIVAFDDGENKQFCRVIKSQDNEIVLDQEISGDVVDAQLLPTKVLTTCEFSIQVFYGGETEIYEKISLNVSAPNYIEKKLARSSLITVEHNRSVESDKAVAPFDFLAGESAGQEQYWISLSGGSDGSVSSVSPADFMGEDRGPGKRTGIQAFIDNDEVSIMAIPGVTDPNVQLSLVAHCENLKSRFAVLDIPQEKKKVADVQTHRNIFDSDYAALYHPWLQVFDPLDKR
ncbi:MAG: phage tail sheath family protein, partial [Syntrophomonadaceae bacterium]|nr:phage tail sheath family protein [Syntrophomonadaceae bacterium]